MQHRKKVIPQLNILSLANFPPRLKLWDDPKKMIFRFFRYALQKGAFCACILPKAGSLGDPAAEKAVNRSRIYPKIQNIRPFKGLLYQVVYLHPIPQKRHTIKF